MHADHAALGASPTRTPTTGQLAQTITSLSAETPLAEALDHLAQAASGAVLVEAAGEFVGILTERTALELTMGGLQYERLLGEVCSHTLLWCDSDESYVEIYERMLDRGVRHALVRGANGQIGGILSETAILNQMGVEHFVHLDSIEQIMTPHPFTLDRSSVLHDALKAMREGYIGCIIVTSGEAEPEGVLTTRDITRLLAQRRDLAQERLVEHMSAPVISLDQRRPVIEAAQLMAARHIRHVVVTDAGKVVGVLSQHDIVRCLEHRYVSVLRHMIARQSDEIDAHRQLIAQTNLLDQLLSRTRELGVCLIARDGRIRFANAATLQLLSIDSNESLETLDQLLLAIDAESRDALCALLDSTETRSPTTLRASGRTMLARAYRIGTVPDGVPRETMLLLVDDRIAAEAGEWLGFSRHAFGAMSLPMVWADKSGRITMKNQAFDQLIGAEADTPEIHDLHWLLEDIPDLLMADDRPEVSIRTRARFRRRDGSSIPVELFFSRMQFRGEAYVGGFIHDQSDQARIEHALQDTEQRLTALLDTSPDFIAVKDPQSRWQMANTAGLRMYGLLSADWRFKNNTELADLLPPPADDALRRCSNTDRLAWSSRQTVRYIEDVPPIGDQPARQLDMLKTPIFDTDGKPKALMVVGRDITERMQAERARREADGRLHSALSGMDDLMIIVNARRVIRDHYPKPAPHRFHMDHGELIGKCIDNLLPPEAAERLKQAQQDLEDGRGVQSFDYRQHESDQTHWFNVRISLHKHLEGGSRGMTLMVRDISATRRTTEALERLRAGLEERVTQRTSELEAALTELEAFSYSLSHDLRAPLRGIAGFSRLLTSDFGEHLPPEGLGYLERIRNSVDRMDRLIDDMLDLARLSRKPLRREPVDLTQMARRIAEELNERSPERHITWDIEPGMHTSADPLLLHSVLDNLMGNAWKFTRDCPEPHIRLYSEPANDGVQFIIEDNGAGFDMAYADKLFQPFQRLHSPRDFDGNGIGLATVDRIIRRHGGRIEGESLDQRGAVFRFTLGH